MLRVVTLLVLSMLSLTACQTLTCGVGTHERDGQCVPNITVGCGAGTHYQQGLCVPDSDTTTTDAAGD